MNFFIKYIKSKQEEYVTDINLLVSFLTMWFTFDKYYKLINKTSAYTSALLFNPTLQKRYLDDHWQALKEQNLSTIEQAIEAAQSLWKKEYKYKPVNNKQVQ